MKEARPIFQLSCIEKELHPVSDEFFEVPIDWVIDATETARRPRLLPQSRAAGRRDSSEQIEVSVCNRSISAAACSIHSSLSGPGAC